MSALHMSFILANFYDYHTNISLTLRTILTKRYNLKKIFLKLIRFKFAVPVVRIVVRIIVVRLTGSKIFGKSA